MKLNSRDKHILEHILEYCNQIVETMERFGVQYELYKDDFVYKNAIALCIIQIGELVGNLTDSFKVHDSAIPWRQIKTVRNIVVHHYGSVDPQVTWEIITTDIPKLKRFCIETK